MITNTQLDRSISRKYLPTLIRNGTGPHLQRAATQTLLSVGLNSLSESYHLYQRPSTHPTPKAADHGLA